MLQKRGYIVKTKKKRVDFSRNQLVVKSNEIIQKARFNLTAEEQKILAYLVSKIGKDDISFVPMLFSIQDFCDVCGITVEGGSAYKYIKDSLKRLSDKSIWVKMPNGNERLVRLLQHVELNADSGVVDVSFDKMMIPYLLFLRERFTQYQLRNVVAMDSKYSPHLYELLKSYEALHEPIIFELEYLKIKLFAQIYKRYIDFKRYVIDMAVSEINHFTDLNVTYTVEKTGRKVSHIHFVVQRKNSLEQLNALTHQELRLDPRPPELPGQIKLDEV
jgi:plasmid replication initiation protein